MIEAVVKIVGIMGSVMGHLARGRPRAEVIAKRIGVMGPYEYLHVQNPGPGSVLIRSVRAHRPGIYGIARDHSPGAITRAQVNIDLKVLLRSGETCDLPLIPLRDPAKVPADAPSLPVWFGIRWRKTSASRLPQIPVVVTTSTGDIKDIVAAASHQRNVP